MLIIKYLHFYLLSKRLSKISFVPIKAVERRYYVDCRWCVGKWSHYKENNKICKNKPVTPLFSSVKVCAYLCGFLFRVLFICRFFFNFVPQLSPEIVAKGQKLSPGDRKGVPRNKSRWLFLKRLKTMAKKKTASVQRGQVKLREKKLKDWSSSLYLDINVGGKRHKVLCRTHVLLANFESENNKKSAKMTDGAMFSPQTNQKQ